MELAIANDGGGGGGGGPNDAHGGGGGGGGGADDSVGGGDGGGPGAGLEIEVTFVSGGFDCMVDVFFDFSGMETAGVDFLTCKGP